MALLASSLARRAFWRRAYAQRRFGTESAAALAPLHYAAFGERLGYRPNGFFDPRFYRERAKLSGAASGLLDHYLAQADGPQPSAEFDPAWYGAAEPGAGARPIPIRFCTSSRSASRTGGVRERTSTWRSCAT